MAGGGFDSAALREAMQGKVCVAQVDARVAADLSEAYGARRRRVDAGQLAAALRRAGFHYVFDTAFAAHVAVAEDGAELAARMAPGRSLFPLVTASCPCWTQRVEKDCPTLLPHLSTCKPPQAIMASLIKTYFARKVGVLPADVFSVTVTHCAGKDDAMRPYLKRYGFRDTDVFLTPREVGLFLKDSGVADVDVAIPLDAPLGLAAGAGSSPYSTNGRLLDAVLSYAAGKFASTAPAAAGEGGTAVQGTVQLMPRNQSFDGVETANAVAAGQRLRVGCVSGADNARKFAEAIARLETPETCGYHFIELTGCTCREVHNKAEGVEFPSTAQNEAVVQLYQEFLEEPKGRMARAVVHAIPGPRAVPAREIDAKLATVPTLPGKPEPLPPLPEPVAAAPAEKKAKVDLAFLTGGAPVANRERLSCSNLKDTVVVIYASVTGKTKALATRFHTALNEAKVNAKLWAAEAVPDLANVSRAVIFTCTQGDGDLPPPAAALWKWLEAQRPGKLQGLTYAVFGLGCSFYPNFNGAAKKLDRKLSSLGANRVIEVGLGDQEAKGSFSTAYDPWVSELFPKMGFTQSKVLTKRFRVVVGFDGSAGVPPPPAKTVYATLTAKRTLTAENYNRPIALVELDLAGTGLTYEVGDDLAIHPENDEAEVRRFLEWYGINGETVVSVQHLSGAPSAALPSNVTVQHLFARYLDLHVRPSRLFFEQLAQFAQDAGHKARLEQLGSAAGAEDLDEYLEENPSHEDVLRDFPSAHPTLDFLVDMIPMISPRLYTVASSSKATGDKCQLLVGIPTEIRRSRGRLHGGLATSWMTRLPVGCKVPVSITVGTLRPPRDLQAPILMCGLGSGLAPMRALLQDRQADKDAHGSVGPATLYQACRYRSNDFIIQDELDAYKKSGVLTTHIGVFSHEDRTRFDTVDLEMTRNPGPVWDVLGKPGAVYYYCGPAAWNIPAKIEAAVTNACCVAGGLAPEEAKAFIAQLKAEGRFLIEAF